MGTGAGECGERRRGIARAGPDDDHPVGNLEIPYIRQIGDQVQR